MTTKRLLCLVTDRLRLARTMGRPPSDAVGLLLEQIAGAVAAGVDLVQIRERDLEARALRDLVRGALRMAAGADTRVVVNERLDVALASGAHGVHLREASLGATEVRRLAPGVVVGRSVHSAGAAARAGPVDYLIAGAVFPTASKTGGEGLVIGLDGLADIVRAAGPTPVLAIGGVAEKTVGAISGAGAAGLAAIGAFIPPAGSADVAADVQKIAKRLCFAFDTGSAVS